MQTNESEWTYKMMAASSRPVYRRMGWRVISLAISGVWQHSKKLWSFRTAWNSAEQEGKGR